jgi:hypothetical protein
MEDWFNRWWLLEPSGRGGSHPLSGICRLCRNRVGCTVTSRVPQHHERVSAPVMTKIKNGGVNEFLIATVDKLNVKHAEQR